MNDPDPIIPGFRVAERLSAGHVSSVFRARRKSDGARVALKAKTAEVRRTTAPGPEPESGGPQSPAEAPLPELAGIDTAAGELRTGGNNKLYRQLPIRFRDSQGDFEAALETLRAIEERLP
jgi:hypothetical protein